MSTVEDGDLLASLIAAGEGRTVEFKEILPDLSTAGGKAQMVKAVLAMANSAAAGEHAYVIFGVRDPARGAEIIGIRDSPTAEQISQILAAYTTPPPDTSFRVLAHASKAVGLLTVTGGSSKPHHAVREYLSDLSPTSVYVRRDRTTGIATSREVEGMLLQRLGQPGHQVDQNPLKAGFIGRGYEGSRTILFRITNVVEETVAGIAAMVDFQHIGLPALVARQAVFGNMTLSAGESREAEIKVADLLFMLRTVEPGLHPVVRVSAVRREGSYLGDWWLNAILRVQWRDSDGFTKTTISEMALDL